MGGAHSRTKGHTFERLVADAYRKAWPTAQVRRSLQAHQPFEPDVVVEGLEAAHPAQLLWTECQHADAPTPNGKLAQAERDLAALSLPPGHRRRLPVVVWRKSGSKTVNMTTRMWVMDSFAGREHHMESWQSLVVTLDFYEWLTALSA